MFQEAERTQLRLLMAIHGPAGSGKSVTALKTMSYLCEGEPFGVVDTENKRALQYAVVPGEEPDVENRRFRFLHAPLAEYDPRNYIRAIETAIKMKLPGLVIDSLSHAWAGKGGVLDMKAEIDRTKGGNSYTNWQSMTKLQNELIELIMQVPFHIICTMRSKMDYVLVEDGGKQKPRKIGLTPVQRDDVEYNFDVVGMLDADHKMTFVKDTSGLLEGKELEKPGREIVEILLPWLNTGTKLPMTRAEFVEQMIAAGYADEKAIGAFVRDYPAIVGTYRFDRLYELATGNGAG